MPTQTIHFRPGMNVQFTPTLLETGWASGNLVRFKDGLPQPLGGWVHINTPTFVGTARGMHGWSDLNGVPYVAVGTEQRLEVLYFGTLFDITPLRATSNIAPNFSTTSGMPTVTVTDTANGVAIGDWINIATQVSVGGLILFGFYQVTSVTDANNFVITATSNATSTVANGGVVPQFTTVNTSTNVTVTLPNHGYSIGSSFNVLISTSVGGITIYGGYLVSNVTGANTFVIVPGAAAASSASAYENSGNAQIQYLVPTGLLDTVFGATYGSGQYGAGQYGGGSGAALFRLREWFLDNWGQDLTASYTNGPIYYWQPNLNPVTPAVIMPNAPLVNTASFVAMPQQIMVGLGCSVGTSQTQDPNLVRWSDVQDFTAWTATATNQAGSYRIPTGSRIMGGLQASTFGLIWTDVDLWTMNYVQPPFVFGFNQVSSGAPLIGAHAAGVYQDVVYWAGPANFYVYSGGEVNSLPCSVWDQFFNNINTLQYEKVICAVNSLFNEVSWYYPSISSTEVDSYVTYNVRDQVWTYGQLVRTAWIDENVLGPPIGCDTNGFMMQHEVGYSADGQALNATITSGFVPISEGDYFTDVKKVIPDFKLFGTGASIDITIATQNMPTDPVLTKGPYNWTAAGVAGVSPYFKPNVRGREVAFTFSSNDTNGSWRLGAVRFVGAPAGRR